MTPPDFVPPESFYRTLEKIEQLKNSLTVGQNGFVLVGGCSRCGKTTFVNQLHEVLKLRRVTLFPVSLDLWLKAASQRERDSGVLERYRRQELLAAISAIFRGEIAWVKPYDPVTREIIAKEYLIAPPKSPFVLIIEGVVALAIKELLDKSHLRIFVSCKDFTRMRRLVRFYRDVKLMTKIDYRALIKAREIEEVPFVKSTAHHAQMIIQR